MKTKKTFQIAVQSIPETGMEVRLELGRDWFSRWQEEDPGLEFHQAAIAGTVLLEKHGRDILVRGRLQGNLSLSCGRCLETFAAPLETGFDVLLVPGPEPATREEEELTAAELDRDYYSGDVVDLEAILREQIILTLPLKPLCAETCKGLCPHCGANLNRETCSCKAEKTDSPFAQLAKLKV